MKDVINQIQQLAAELTANEQAHLEKGNKAAGVRARKASLELGKLLKAHREKSIELDK